MNYRAYILTIGFSNGSKDGTIPSTVSGALNFEDPTIMRVERGAGHVPIPIEATDSFLTAVRACRAAAADPEGNPERSWAFTFGPTGDNDARVDLKPDAQEMSINVGAGHVEFPMDTTGGLEEAIEGYIYLRDTWAPVTL